MQEVKPWQLSCTAQKANRKNGVNFISKNAWEKNLIFELGRFG